MNITIIDYVTPMFYSGLGILISAVYLKILNVTNSMIISPIQVSIEWIHKYLLILQLPRLVE